MSGKVDEGFAKINSILNRWQYFLVIKSCVPDLRITLNLSLVMGGQGEKLCQLTVFQLTNLKTKLFLSNSHCSHCFSFPESANI